MYRKSFLLFNPDALDLNLNKFLLKLLRPEYSRYQEQNLWISLMKEFKLFLDYALETWEELLTCFKYLTIYLVPINDEQGRYDRGSNCLWFYREPKPKVFELDTWRFTQLECLWRIPKDQQFSKINGNRIGDNLEKYLSPCNREKNAKRTTSIFTKQTWRYRVSTQYWLPIAFSISKSYWSLYLNKVRFYVIQPVCSLFLLLLITFKSYMKKLVINWGLRILLK